VITDRRYSQGDDAAVWNVIDSVWSEFGVTTRAAAVNDLKDVSNAYGDAKDGFWVAEAVGKSVEQLLQNTHATATTHLNGFMYCPTSAVRISAVVVASSRRRLHTFLNGKAALFIWGHLT
jgi:hypothetical protein